MLFCHFALWTVVTSLALALVNPRPSLPAPFNRGIKVPPEHRAPSSRSETSVAFDPKQWFKQGSPKPDSPSLSGTPARSSPGSCAALSKGYADMGGPMWFNKTGWVEEFSDSSASPMPCCGWHGVLCKGNVISTLVLSSNGLNGPLPPALFTLPGLENM